MSEKRENHLVSPKRLPPLVRKEGSLTQAIVNVREDFGARAEVFFC